MARIDDLIAQVADKTLKTELLAALLEMKRHQTFGLVFEEHIPETVLLPSLPIHVGAVVQRSADAGNNANFRVTNLSNRNATVETLDGIRQEKSPIKDLVVVKRFGEPIYPALRSIGTVKRGAGKPFHAVISGENFHALQLFHYLYAHQVDCIYIDPPYNTGARDWKYNNHYVDKNDTWRHSKWLSFMQKRLKLAKQLLRTDGVLVVAIDENEHAHLVMLLEQIFTAHDVTSIAIVHNPRGIQGDNFSYINDFAVFVIPKGQKIISNKFLAPEERDTRDLRDNGGESLRTNAKNCFYPILVKNKKIVGFGNVPLDNFHPLAAEIPIGGGVSEIWPIDRNGIERKWRYARHSIERIMHILSVAQTRSTSVKPGSIQIKITKETGRYRTVWSGSRYDANAYGTKIVQALTGAKFPFPKSIFNVKDILHACTADRPNALILDFFAGSGTTLHATCLLNAETNGRRRCILVTNNEVAEKDAKELRALGHFPGSHAYEARGIFAEVTQPRIMAAINGKGSSSSGLDKELDGRRMDEGFAENVEFFEMNYLDADEVDLGKQFDAILPALWLAAGGIGGREVHCDSAWSLPSNSTYAILFKESRFRAFLQALQSRPDITHVWLVTDSQESFAEMNSALPRKIRISMLYRDYLRNFQINTRFW